MTRKFLITLFASFSLLFTACGTQTSEETVPTPQSTETTEPGQGAENELFKKADISDYPEMANVKEHVFTEGSIDDTLNLLENGTGAIFFSYAECPYCNLVMPTLNDVALENGYSIVLLDAYREDFDKEAFNKFVEIYPGVESEDGNIYTPQLIIVKDGEIINSFTGVPGDFSRSDDESGTVYLNDEQKGVVADTYREMLSQIK